MRSLVQRTALALAAVVGLLGTRPATANAQKALVYCPVALDATGCNAIVNALTGPAYPLGVDKGYDGTSGTVDLKAVDLFSYSVFVVPSLADDATSQPYAKLRDPEVVEHLKAALIGRLAMWSGSPDQGATNRAMKDALIQNLTGWAAGAYATARGPGLVTLLDASASATSRYDWVRAITPVPVTSDPALLIYSSVRALNQRATTILTSGAGPIAYDNIATFGFQVPNGAAGVSLDAVGQTGTPQGGQVVLVTMEAGNSAGALVKTDRDDYAPGETVTITGSGWQPGETIKLSLHMDPLRDSDTELTATADGTGNFTNTDFAPAEYDLHVRFVLTATGQSSGRRAQTTFTDSRTINSATLNGASSVVVSAGENITALVNATTDNGGGNNDWESTSWRINTTPPGAPGPVGTCANTGDHTSSGTFAESFTVTAPALPGTYNAYFIAHTGQACATSQQSAVFTLTNGVVVLGTQTISSISPTSAFYGDAGFTLTVNGTNFTGTSVVTFNGVDRATTFNSSSQLTAAIPASALLTVGVFDVNVRNGAGVLTAAAQFSVNKRPITITADAKSKVYGNTDPALTYQITSGSLVGTDNFTGSLTRDVGENVGAYAIKQGTVALSNNYALTYVGANFTIAQRSLTITADPKTKVYGDADPALTYVVSGGPLVGTDAVTGLLARLAGENIGSYAIQQGTVTAGANYAITYIGANLTITARPLTVTADPGAKVYGDADPAFTYQVTSGSLVSGDTFSGALSRVTGENVGTYALQIGMLTAGTNYNITFVPANLTISVRPITVTADAKTKVYGDADPPLTYQVTSGSLAFTDVFSGALTRAPGEVVGMYAINQGTLSAGTNYNLTFVGANLSITARPVTVTADAKSKTYGDSDPALTYQITSGSLAFSDAFSGALTRVAGANVGTYAIQQGTLALSSNYNLSFVSANLTITARPITVTADAKTKMYGDADPALTYQITTGNLVGSDAFNGALSRVGGENVGTYTIQQGTLTAGTNYNLTFVGANLSITTRPITVTADPQTKVYGNADPIFSYQVTSGSLVSGDSFSGSPSRATGESVGTYAINQGTLSAGTNYALTFVGANLTINTRPVTVTADPKTKVYGNADPALTYQISSGSLAFSDAFTGALNRAPGENVGTYAITQGTLALNSNYVLSFVGADLTITVRPITVTADPKTKVYGDADPALTHQITSGSLAFEDQLTGNITRDPGENVGSYAITQGTLAATTNYALTFVPSTLTITKRPITVTANAETKVYGNADPAFTYQITSGNLIGSDALSGTLSRAGGEAVGTYAIAQGGLTAGGNYDLTFAGALLTITKRPVTVTANANTKTYGDADPTLTYAITSGSLAFSDAFSGLLTRDAGENVGTYAIHQGALTLGGNYDLSFVGANFTITKRGVTITADAKSKIYGDADPALTYHISIGSLAFSDAFTGSLTRVAGENVGSYAIQQGTVALNPTNYDLSYLGTNLTIDPRLVTVTADPKTKVYGNADPSLTYQITSGNLVGTDAFSGALTRAAGENVGTHAVNQGTLALSTNYALTYVGANLTITQRPIAVAADAKSKTYGDADPALTYQITSGNLVFGDTFNGSLTRVAGENVGTYAIQVGTLTAGGNYALTYSGADLTITQRAVTVTADAKTKVYGNGDPALTYQLTTGSLAFSDAFNGALTRVAGENVGMYAIEQGTLALSSNYNLSFVGATLEITKRAVTITADPKTKTYGDGDPALTFQITSGSLAFSDAVAGAVVRVAGENVGTYAINQGTVALNGNYMLSFVPGVFSITQRAVTITADPKSKTYGDGDPALTYQLTSGTLVAGDGITGALTRVSGENVGTYAIDQGTVTAGANYNLSYVGATLTINQRGITITADAKSKTYGVADPALTYQITSGNLAFSDAFSGSLARAAGENVGSYAITQGTVTAGANYNLSFVPANLTIGTRAITVTAAAKSKIYGDNDPALTYQITTGSLAFSDAFAGGLARVAGENVGTYAIQQGTLALSANYALSYVGANLTITTRSLVVTAANASKIAGAVNPPLTGTVVGVQFSDNITATYSTTAVTLSPPGGYPIVPAIVDPNGKISNYAVTLYNGTLTVTDNAKPVLGAFSGPLLPVPLGTSINLSIPFTDVDVAASQPYTATIDWGNSTTSTSAFTTPGTISGTKLYPAAGVYIVKVTVNQDNFPLTHFDTKTYEYYVVVYDPNGGFVTGGGWIDSPAGAYVANPSLTGKANFGFVAKYKKGQTTPDGNTEFQYQAGNLNFKATSFDWLVIAGSKAQFKGSGTINGSGDYGFMLTAVDGELKGKSQDTFRMKIWIKSTGAIVYDNLLNAPDSTDPTTALGGGSIQIHDK